MILKHAGILFLTLVVMAFEVHHSITKKVEKEVKETFHLETVDISQFLIDRAVAKDLPSEFNDENFYKVESSNNLVGYVYMAQAPSKTALFDYLVLLDKDLVVVKTKVLAYREEYGGEIGSKRWLKQFIGKNQNDELKYGENIIAISGATISVRSMTNAVNNLLQSLKILSSKNIL